MCDLVHALWVERIIEDTRSAQLSVRLARMWGAKGTEWPSLGDQIERFEGWLLSEPKELDPDETELRAALGLRRTGG